MRVAVLCEYSGKVRDAFIARGHEAVSFDMLPSESDKGPHVVGDVKQTFSHWYGARQGFDLVIAHPPCTYLSNSGVRWLYTKDAKANNKRWRNMEFGAELFKWCMNLPVPRIAVENPIMHKYAVEIIGRRQDQIVQPWQFGHGETKATGLWLKNLPPLVPTDVVDGREGRIHKLPPSADRGKIRSETYTGIAEAIAEQWGGLDG